MHICTPSYTDLCYILKMCIKYKFNIEINFVFPIFSLELLEFDKTYYSILQKQDLVYVSQISSCLWHRIIYRELVYINCINEILSFFALYYIPKSRFYKRDLVYINEISSILCRCIIYQHVVSTFEISYM